MKTVTAKLSDRYQMVLPKEARRALGLQAGDTVLVIIEGDTVRLIPRPASYAKYARGLGQEAWNALGGADAFLAEERASWE
jgi:AbrB family looped-hinge helix DNA binding protein